MYALKVLRSHCMCDDELKDVCRAVIMNQVALRLTSLVGGGGMPRLPIDSASKHLCAERSDSACMAQAGDPSANQLAEDADDSLFSRVMCSATVAN